MFSPTVMLLKFSKFVLMNGNFKMLFLVKMYINTFLFPIQVTSQIIYNGPNRTY